MNAKVSYNDNHEPTTIDAREGFTHGHVVTFSMHGSTAVVSSIKPADGEAEAYGDDVMALMEYVEELPFVQAVGFGEMQPEGDE